VISCVLVPGAAWRVAWYGVAKASSSGSGGVQRAWALQRSRAVGLTPILD